MSIRLMDAEQELCRRVGPFDVLTVTSNSVGTRVMVDDLISTIDDGDYADRWVLRRGLDAAGVPVAIVAATDRCRRVDRFDHEAGALVVDRPYAAAVMADEVVELGVLHPTRQLRQAVRTGLTRCFFEDRVALDPLAPSSTGMTWREVSGMTWREVALGTWNDLAPDVGDSPERDLTSELFWLTRPTQLRGIATLATGAVGIPEQVAWWEWFMTRGQVRVAIAPPYYPDTVYVTALRPHASWVNHADSATGPVNDRDLLDVDLEYAVVAAHKYAWEAFAERLQIAAKVGLAPSEADVSRGWRVQIRGHVRPPPDRLQLAERYPAGALA